MSELTDKLQLICERGLRAGDTKIIREAIGLIETYGAIAAEATTDLKKSRERVAELEAHVQRLNKQCNALYDEAINAGCCSEYMKVNYASGESVQAIMGGKK